MSGHVLDVLPRDGSKSDRMGAWCRLKTIVPKARRFAIRDRLARAFHPAPEVPHARVRTADDVVGAQVTSLVGRTRPEVPA